MNSYNTLENRDVLSGSYMSGAHCNSLPLHNWLTAHPGDIRGWPGPLSAQGSGKAITLRT